MIEQSIYVPLLTFLVGLVVGHRFALSRDKRKEFNEASVPLFEKLYNGVQSSSTSFFPDNLQLELFSSHVPFHKRYFYKQAVISLTDSLKADKEAVKWNSDEAEMQLDKGYESQSFKSAEKVMKYLKRK
ncbi:hypothetical protein [Echinimonas agarilytica]|uniref:Uncharacterized protein n=1 Tax=Echinimonas agarilytica TaxID=1215918 RepID=A0AA41W8H4_9GAMM|nr:hypothetical protein [Echinimonas agarilytica]MCM2680623.1 hypothetical protein [Echinimonas agarilytica]